MLKLLSVFILRGRSHLLPLRLFSNGATGKNPKEHKPRANNRSPTSPLHFTPLRSTQPSIWLFLPAPSLFITRYLSLSRVTPLYLFTVLSFGHEFLFVLLSPLKSARPFLILARERETVGVNGNTRLFLFLIHCVSFFFLCNFVSCDLILFLISLQKSWKICKFYFS